MINLTVTDVETGEIISCVPADGSAKASRKWARFDYNGVTFGGNLFFKTPIGRATREALHKAVNRIVRDIPYTTWKPRIADTTAESVIINGGENVGVQEGDLFDVREEGRSITDPGTGNVVDYIAGTTVARIKIIEVRPTTADGIVISGRPQRGFYLKKVIPASRPITAR